MPIVLRRGLRLELRGPPRRPLIPRQAPKDIAKRWAYDSMTPRLCTRACPMRSLPTSTDMNLLLVLDPLRGNSVNIENDAKTWSRDARRSVLKANMCRTRGVGKSNLADINDPAFSVNCRWPHGASSIADIALTLLARTYYMTPADVRSESRHTNSPWRTDEETTSATASGGTTAASP